MVGKLKILIVFMFAGLFAMADNVEFVMEGPDVVAMGEQFRLGFTVNDRGTDLQLPDLSNFDVLMGPSTSQSSSIQIINGKTTQSSSFSYIFVLRAKKEGKFTIRPASIKVGGKTYESNSLNIQVVKGQPQQQQSQGGQQQSAGGGQQQDDTPTGYGGVGLAQGCFAVPVPGWLGCHSFWRIENENTERRSCLPNGSAVPRGVPQQHPDGLPLGRRRRMRGLPQHAQPGAQWLLPAGGHRRELHLPVVP